MRKTGSLYCSAYDKLRPVQKRWIHVHEAGGGYTWFGGNTYHEAPFLMANPSKFEKTAYKTIALEIRVYNDYFFGEKIDSNSMYQFIRVLNYAHDQGGRRIILINQTRYSAEQLLVKIKAQLPASESERTWSRLVLLLCETQDAIFSYGQFNGQIEETSSKQFLSQERCHGVADLSILNRRLTPLSTLGMGGARLLDSAVPLKDSTHENDSVFETMLSCEVVKKSIPIPRGMFTKQRRKLEDVFLIEHRHDNSALQHEYDKRFGLI